MGENLMRLINLNGENIFGIWNKSKKQKVFESRVKFTRNRCKKVSEMDEPPKVLISASAIRIYGNDNDIIFSYMKKINRNDNDNSDFLSYVFTEWEKATDIAKSAGIRVVNLRTGIVLYSITLIRRFKQIFFDISIKSYCLVILKYYSFKVRKTRIIIYYTD